MVLMHLVFYDGTCGLCDHMVQWLLKVDKSNQFKFAPLQGVTAKKVLSSLPLVYQEADSLILVENYDSDHSKFFLFGRGVFRICWLLGGKWKLLGWISFLPSWLYDWGYRLVAKNRHRLFSEKCIIPNAEFKNRFLP